MFEGCYLYHRWYLCPCHYWSWRHLIMSVTHALVMGALTMTWHPQSISTPFLSLLHDFSHFTPRVTHSCRQTNKHQFIRDTDSVLPHYASTGSAHCSISTEIDFRQLLLILTPISISESDYFIITRVDNYIKSNFYVDTHKRDCVKKSLELLWDSY